MVGPTTIERLRVADQIFKDLKDRIVLGDFPNGSKLPSERELAKQYHVSPPTVREAIRGLSAIGLANVRHGSGIYVTADTQYLMALSLGTLIQLEGLGAGDVLSLLAVLNGHAAELACRVATPRDHARLRSTMKALEGASTGAEAATAVRGFHAAIAAAAHNPLLSALCGFLAQIQAQLGIELTGDVIDQWRLIFSELEAVRSGLVNAIVARDVEGAAACSRAFHEQAMQMITSLPKARTVRLSDPKLRALLSEMMGRLGSR